jgi:hypothetical protein
MMKNKLFYIIILFLVVACNHKEYLYQYPDFIIVGQKSGVGINYAEPHDTICDHFCYPTQTLSVDLNNDRIFDFEFVGDMSDWQCLSSGHNSLVIIPLENNSICVSASNPTWADSLLYLDTINNHRIWSDSTAIIYSYEWSTVGYHNIKGFWFNTNNYSIGVKISKDDHQYYGWLKVGSDELSRYALTIPYVQ